MERTKAEDMNMTPWKNHLAAGLILAAGTASAADIALVPKPVSMQVKDGAFTVQRNTVIVYDSKVQSAEATARYLSSVLAPAFGFTLATVPGESATPGSIALLGGAPPALGSEGYTLESSPDGVVIRGNTNTGLFHGVQTLRQLLPAAVLGPRTEGPWTVPAVAISDTPRYPWRGLMLDCCRHYFSVEYIKKFIDVMALHKMSMLHWHLTEDQGWRLEVERYPELAKIGSLRKESPKAGDRNRGDGQPYGPFYYTKAQMKEIVAYAGARHIIVVPEIEMPGHSQAALAAYPKLSCTGGPFEVGTRWGVMPDIYCAGNDDVYRMLEGVLTEVMEIFPSRFIHIGGDEAPKDRWDKCPKCQARIKALGLKNSHQLQSYFVKHFDRFLESKGRRLIGWDEILEGGLAPGAAVMSWRGMDGGTAAATSGHDVVMAPNSHCYLDYAQANGPGEPEAIGGNLPLSKVYSLNPTPSGLPAALQKHILGVQGNLWTEYIGTPEKADYFSYPRACAIAETGWTPQESRDYKDFLQRLRSHTQRLDALGVHYRKLTD